MGVFTVRLGRCPRCARCLWTSRARCRSNATSSFGLQLLGLGLGLAEEVFDRIVGGFSTVEAGDLTAVDLPQLVGAMVRLE